MSGFSTTWLSRCVTAEEYLEPEMLGVYFYVWVLTLLDLRISGSTCCMAGIGYTATVTCCTGSGSIGAGLVGGMLGSTISITCGS